MKISDQLLSMKNGDNRSLDIYSLKTKKQILKIKKKGDFGIQTFDMLGHYIAYSDCIDTQIFKFDPSELSLVKLTKKICHSNDDLHSISPALWLKLYADEYSNSKMTNQQLKCIMIGDDLKVRTIHLETLEVTDLVDLKDMLRPQDGGRRFRKYDQIFNLVDFDPRLQGMLTMNFVNSDLFYMVQLNSQ